MEIDELKNEWNNIKTPKIELDRFKEMSIENSHPVLKSIRRQLLFELIGWSVFLFICYTGLDADQKPILANIALLLSVAFPMIFNIYGYGLSKNLIAGPDISTSLKNRIDSLKRFAVISVLLRLMLIAGVGYFFTSAIYIDERKLIILSIAIVLLILPLCFLVRTWIQRIGKLSSMLRSLNEDD
ncbi:MAG: hypothetical protein EOP48_13095 [Sphingobacteriales bacterium]|nr:MAG: hypothetical protein EOP48_13095 [Sphingobacteriales bacterium]